MQNRQRCAIAVMAKAPRAGHAKTRLCPPLLPEQAATLSAAFLRDVTENLALAARHARISRFVAFAPAGSAKLFADVVAAGTGLILADGSPDMPDGVSGFGRCLLHAVQTMLADGFAAACVLNSDSPTLPTALLVQAAHTLLMPGERIVLGPAEDGGYYLLGMKSAHTHLFTDIAWSTRTVAAATRERARALGVDTVELPSWYDVDDCESLARLLNEVSRSSAAAELAPYAAPATAATLRKLQLSGTPRAQAAE